MNEIPKGAAQNVYLLVECRMLATRCKHIQRYDKRTQKGPGIAFFRQIAQGLVRKHSTVKAHTYTYIGTFRKSPYR